MWNGVARVPTRELVVGLINGYGAVALHGNEGFRAQLATIACIFTDRLQPIGDLEERRPHFIASLSDSLNWIFGYRDPLTTIADRYGVPCVSLECALSMGLLQELGVGLEAIRQVQYWLRGGWRPPSKPRPPSLRLRAA